MPLIHGKSEKSFSKNIATEMEHGKPQKQALAIAYAIKRAAQKKFKGGMIEENPASAIRMQEDNMHHEDLERAEMFAIESPEHVYPHLGEKHEAEFEYQPENDEEKKERRHKLLAEIFAR